MNLYVPKRGVDNLLFILEMFVDTHSDSEASNDEVKLAQDPIRKIEGVNQ